MCGIAGVMKSGWDERVVLDQLRLLGHRGPDSVGVYEGVSGAIGQARLAVIDLVTGDPPITGEDGRVVVVLNGEIYNFQQLRHELRTAGHDFKTDCDTEVIAHLGEDHPPAEICRRLDGMFAFALWDSRTQDLVLARDRVGKKPLYYWHAPSGDVSFASEIKALLSDPRVPHALAPGAIDAYLTFGYVPTPRTFFEGILSVRPGYVLRFRPGSTPEEICYWRPELQSRPSSIDIDLEEAGREVRRLLSDAVEKRMIADVPLGAFLSGGVDSSAVVALMARLNPRRVKTFTIGFDDSEGFDERPFAGQLAQIYGTEHTEFVVNPDKVDLIERLVWHYDQPFGDSSALPMYLLSELTKRHVTVALCGDGGDELFAGYERLAAAALLEHSAFLPQGTVNAVCGLASKIPSRFFRGRGASVQRMLERAQLGNPWALLAWISYISPEWRTRLRPDGDDWALTHYEALWRETAGIDPVNRLLDLNLRTYLLDDLLPKADRMSMAHGLEVRSPFLDTELLEFAFSLPGQHKIRAWGMKRVLKEAVRDIVPRELLHRRKRGFGVPLDRWFRTDLRSYTESMLTSTSARLQQHLDAGAVHDLVVEHMTGVGSHGHALWTLLTLEIFLERQDW